MKAMDILAGDHRQRFFGFRSFSLDVYYIDSSPREPRFVLVPLRFASKAWPRAGLGEPRSASNANKPASSWPLKQGRKKCSKHGCDRGTSTVHARTAARRVLGPSSVWFLAAVARMSRASSSGDRGCSMLAVLCAGASTSHSGASLVLGRLVGITNVGCTRHPSKK